MVATQKIKDKFAQLELDGFDIWSPVDACILQEYDRRLYMSSNSQLFAFSRHTM